MPTTEGKNLIVLPLSLLNQWQAELKRFLPMLTFMEYYGGGRHKRAVDGGIKNCDVVFTTYGTLRMEKEGHPHSMLLNTRWRRVILDE